LRDLTLQLLILQWGRTLLLLNPTMGDKARYVRENPMGIQTPPASGVAYLPRASASQTHLAPLRTQ
jgi:hypothetical protein